MHAVLQTASPSHACRLVDLLTRSSPNVFPGSNYELQATVFIRSLVLLKNVEVPPRQFIAWFKASLFYRHVSRIYWLHGQCESESLSDLVTAVVDASPTFFSLKIMCYPRQLEMKIATALPLDIELDPRQSSHVLSVIQEEKGCQFGITERADNVFQLPKEPKSFADASSTAVNKLNEAFHFLQLQDMSFNTATDLGASPGGWTSYLSHQARCKMIYAIDSADMAESVKGLDNVVHIKQVALDAVKELWRKLSARGVVGVDLLVSDMNMTPYTLLEHLDIYAPLLKPQGRLIATLKFFGRSSDRSDHLKDFKARLESRSWMDVRFIWLLANTKSERMVTAIRKD